MKYSLKFIDSESEVVQWVRTGKIKRIYHFIQAEESLGVAQYQLCVSYGFGRDCFGKLVRFENEGTFLNKTVLVHALKAFTEHDD